MLATIPRGAKESSPTPSVEALEDEIYGKFKQTYSMFFGRSKHNKNELYIETSGVDLEGGKDEFNGSPGPLA